MRFATPRSTSRRTLGTLPRNRGSSLALLAALLLLLVPSLFAHAAKQCEVPELCILEEEKVSIAIGLGREQRITDAPSNVYVITDEDIKQSGAIDIPTILRRIPGIEVMQMTAADFNVSVRGDNQQRANKLLVLIDGRSVYVDVQSEVLWKTFPVTLPEIKRIEVLKGPASALYGFNAFDGIINIITKSPEEMKGATLQFGGGAYGSISGAAIYANRHDKLGYRLSYGHDQTQKWRQGDSLGFRTNKFNGQFDYELPGQARLLVSGGFVGTNNYDGPIVDTILVSQKPEQGYANLLYERPNAFFRAWWTILDQSGPVGTYPTLQPFLRFFDRNGTTQFDQTWNSYNLEGQHAVDLWAANRLTYGIQYRYNTANSNFLNQFTTENRLGLYVQDEWKFTDKLTGVAGVRYDMDTFINPTVSPRGSLIYRPAEDHTFRAEISVAYRSPTIFEEQTQSFGTLSGVLNIPPCLGPIKPPFCFLSATTALAGNNGLVPEEIVSYDLGYQGWYWNHRLKLRADLFFNHISNLISQSVVPLQGGTFVNGRQADIFGGEAGFEVQATPWLSGFANYSFQEITQSLTGIAQRGGPKYKANGGVRLDFDNGLNGEAALHYYGAATYPVGALFQTIGATLIGAPTPVNTHVGSYFLLNLRGGYRFWQEKAAAGHLREAEVAVSAFNALNDKHREHPLGDEIGSRVMGWLTVKY
jgi:outer membrane receptor protein involved in Fe transport